MGIAELNKDSMLRRWLIDMPLWIKTTEKGEVAGRE
jgi:hypothetical protein